MTDPNDILFGTLAPVISAEENLVIRGRVLELNSRHARKFDRNKPRNQGDPLWFVDGKLVESVEKPNGNARAHLEPVFTIQTAFDKWEYTSNKVSKDGPDDGQRRIIAQGRSKDTKDGSLLEAIKTALRTAGCGRTRKVEAGDFIEVRINGKGKPASKGLNPPWLWACTYWLSSNAPEWASEIPSEVAPAPEDDDDNPFA